MDHVQRKTIADLISPLSTVRRSSPEKTLGSVLSQRDSSHAAVFIFDKHTFLGLVSPQRALYAKNYPYTTIVSSLLTKPPMMTKQTPLYEAAEYMLSLGIYSLPVFHESGEVAGVIHAKDILQHIIDDTDMLTVISSFVKPKKPITAPRNTSVKDIYHLLKEKNVSRIVLVDDEGDLAGIVSRGDLKKAFMQPTPKERFPQEGSHIGFYSLAGEKKFRTDAPVLRYATVAVDALPDTTPKDKIVLRLVTSPYNSVVLVSNRRKPTGFLSLRDLLSMVSLFRPEDSVPLIMKKPSSSVPEDEVTQAEEHLKRFGRKLKKRMAIEKIEVATEEPKNRKEQTRAFNTTLIVTPVAGKSLVAVTKQKQYLDSVQEATALIEKQRRRKGASREETQRLVL
jgi:CBS domain-containing protein